MDVFTVAIFYRFCLDFFVFDVSTVGVFFLVDIIAVDVFFPFMDIFSVVVLPIAALPTMFAGR